eukprot:gb/GFBE01008704.1/.p1 GENE.gb/GFBE01008704.1/~~gb/GFBE01008704.1/.p1  ORF type:complete len:638 (+),score=178.08 gb/GFBE01008704.1/:1-1914(+)
MSTDMKPVMLMGCAACGLGWFVFFIVLFASIKVVNDQQQILFFTPTERYIKNGPFTEIVWPHIKHEVRDAVRISERQYAALKHERTQIVRHIEGPELVFMDAYEALEGVYDKTVLQKQEYIRLIDKMTGEERVIMGATTLVPEPLEEAPDGIERAIVISEKNAVLVANKSSGIKRLVTKNDQPADAGPFVPAPYEEILKEQQAVVLDAQTYAIVMDRLTGQKRNELGPKQLHIGPYEELLNVSRKLKLEMDEYIQLVEKTTGFERVVKGPQQVVPEPTEEYPDGIQKAVFLTTQTACLVLNRETGQQRLEKTPGVFIPDQYEKVLEIRNKYMVLPNQAAVTRDVFGNLTMYIGASSNSFFLEPYTELVKMYWSLYDTPGATEPVPKEEVTMIDLRAHKMFFNNEVRTSDNVKLRLEGTIFWQVKDVIKMIAMTADPSGDVSQRAKSGLISAVSRATFAVFMNEFNNITAQAFQEQAADGFYVDRGIELQSLELTKYDMVDQETADILQLIIQESTNRINQLQKAESENDVKAAKLVSDIQLEKQRTELIKTQASNTKLEAVLEGQAAGAEIVESAVAFIDGLNASIPDVNDRTDLYKLHQTLDGRNIDTENLVSGQAQLYLTPSNLNLRLSMDKDEF